MSKRNDDTEYETVTDATVSLFLKEGTDSTLIGMFTCIKDSIYTISYSPVEGKVYSISVEYGDYKAYSSTTMPATVYRSFTPNPIVFVGLNNYPIESNLIFKYPSYRLMVKDSATVWAFFSKNGRMAEKLYTSFSNVDNFNILSEGYSRTYERGCGELDLMLDYMSYDREYVNVYYPYHSYLLRLPFSNSNELTDYEFPALNYIYSNSPQINTINVRDFINNHPELGTISKDLSIWGPAFLINPANLAEAETLNLISVSPEYDRYLRTNMELYMKHLSTEDFTSVFSTDSPYSNIVSGKGIFGAAYIYEEDYASMQSKLIEEYNKL